MRLQRYFEAYIYLIREFADALHQVLVGLPVTGNDLTHDWNHLEAVGVIQSAEKKRIHIYSLAHRAIEQAHNDATP